MELKTKSQIKIDTQILWLLIILTILLVLSGIVKSLIVPPGAEILAEEVFYSLFLSVAMGFFAGGFIIQAFIEENNFNKILCFTGGSLIAIAAIFGPSMLIYVTIGLLGSILIAELAIILALTFLFISLGILALRRA